MPIVDVELVGAADPDPTLACRLASALGRVFGSPPGRTWVRLRRLPASDYAENDAPLGAGEAPVFVTVLHAHPPTGEALQRELAVLTATVAAGVARPAERVHVQYAPAAAGRQAFGGQMVS
jgi:phenylpyruvate tautomerase PptA (4-oxalocrotonate tautomerase family)